MGMLVIIVRSTLIYALLVLGIRMMGKRTIGELQPYEFVIVLAVADLACLPMQDISVSIFYGLVPLAVVFLLHYIMTAMAAKSIKFRKFLNGKPFIIIDGDGINSECLTRLDINVNDLMAMIRQQGYFSLTQIKYGVIETNGRLSLLANEEAEPPQSVPMTLVVEGRMMQENMSGINITEEQVNKMLADYKLKLKDVMLMTADSQNVFIQPKRAKYFTVRAAA